MSSRAEIDGLLSAAVGEGVAPGIVAAAVSRDRVVYEGAFGRRGVGSDDPMRADTIFWIASMTKAVTSVAAMQLVEAGSLSLDEPLGRIAPELGSPSILEGFDRDGAPRLRPAKNAITLKHLLTHTSGLSDDVWDEGIEAYMRYCGLPPSSSRKLASLNIPLLFEPGTSWTYGNGHEWVGRLVEIVSGKRIDEYMRENVFDPLRMADSGWELDAERKKRAARVQQRASDGGFTPIVRELPATREYLPGGGALYSTAADYLTFIRMILNGGCLGDVRILDRESVSLMARNHTNGLRVSVLSPAMAKLSNPVDVLQGRKGCWGLGFQINLEPLPTGRAAGSLSWAGLGNTYYWIDPTSGLGGVVLTQVLPFADRQVLDLFAKFETAIYDMKSAVSRTHVPGSAVPTPARPVPEADIETSVALRSKKTLGAI